MLEIKSKKRPVFGLCWAGFSSCQDPGHSLQGSEEAQGEGGGHLLVDRLSEYDLANKIKQHSVAFKLAVNPQINFQNVFRRLNGCNRLIPSFLINNLTSIGRGVDYVSGFDGYDRRLGLFC